MSAPHIYICHQLGGFCCGSEVVSEAAPNHCQPLVSLVVMLSIIINIEVNISIEYNMNMNFFHNQIYTYLYYIIYIYIYDPKKIRLSIADIVVHFQLVNSWC